MLSAVILALSFDALIPDSPCKTKVCVVSDIIFSPRSAYPLILGPGLWIAGAAEIHPLGYF